MSLLRACRAGTSALRLLGLLAAVFSVAYITAGEFVPEHGVQECSQECDQDCGGEPENPDQGCTGCVGCLPVAKIVAIVEAGNNAVTPSVSWAAYPLTLRGENTLADEIDHPPQNLL